MGITNLNNLNENKTLMSTNYETGNLTKFYSSHKNQNNQKNKTHINNYINIYTKNQLDINNCNFNLLELSEKIDNFNLETNTRETS
jgi:hypothetical protein